MSLHDTIIARSSAPGVSLRALLRISGPDTLPLAHLALTELHTPSPLSPPQTRRHCGTALLALPPAHLSTIICLFPGPASYTGEDTLELIVPGNPLLIDRIIDHLISTATTSNLSLRRAGPGEFSARAYLHGKISLTKAEGIAALIAAETSEQLTMADELASGQVGLLYASWADRLANLLALVEAGIDFTDQEDVVAISTSKLHSSLDALLQELISHTGSPTSHRESIPRVALAGKPNAGKSTLLNALLGHTRAVVSPVAGTTRDVIEEPLNLADVRPGAGSVLLQDLAGLDHQHALKSGPLEQAGQDAARHALQNADVILWCDPTGHFNEQQFLPQGLPKSAHIIRVRTFGDQLLLNPQQDQSRPAASSITVCALDNFNLSVLRRALADVSIGQRRITLAGGCPRV